MDWFVKYCRSEYDVEIVFSVEEEPLELLDPLPWLAKYIAALLSFWTAMSFTYPFHELLDFHQSRSRGTLMVIRSRILRNHGVIQTERGANQQFIEKPKVPVGDKINAGMYCFSKRIRDRIRPVKTSIETEIFSSHGWWRPVIQQGVGGLLDGYWSAKRLSQDHVYIFSFLKKSSVTWFLDLKEMRQVDQSAVIERVCVIGPNVVIGKNCVNMKMACIHRTVLSMAFRIKRGSYWLLYYWMGLWG